jgi:hypothetical protein
MSNKSLAALRTIGTALTKTRETVAGLQQRNLEVPQYLAGFHDALALAGWAASGHIGRQPAMIGEKAERLRPAEVVESDENLAALHFYYAQLADMVRDLKRLTAEGKPASLIPVFDAVNNLDEFVGTLDKAGEAQVDGAPDAGIVGQEGSTPSPAASTGAECQA